MEKAPIFNFLTRAGLISSDTACLFDETCRDASIKVYRDSRSSVIYLDPEFIGKSNQYYDSKFTGGSAIPRNEVDALDTERRSDILIPLISGKTWVDFGCGPGYQIRRNSHVCRNYLGIELNEMDRESLNQDGYYVSNDLDAISEIKPDVISLFHVLEHLSDPVAILKKLNQMSLNQTQLLVEVPHARDWLIQNGPTEFRSFTFWSEHLVLHTRQSLQLLLAEGGWSVISEIALQRYPVWNHLHWLGQKRPSGFNEAIHDVSACALQKSYENYLATRDQTDTLLFYCKKMPINI